MQNEELTAELDKLVNANESFRQQIDRKEKIQEIRGNNEKAISNSVRQYQS
jgi:hypothetical protein